MRQPCGDAAHPYPNSSNMRDSAILRHHNHTRAHGQGVKEVSKRLPERLCSVRPHGCPQPQLRSQYADAPRVRSCLQYLKSTHTEKARALSDSELSPIFRFVDLGGHGYTIIRVSGEYFETELVCVSRTD